MRKGEATRIRIIDEALRLVSVRGLAAISLADVAEPSGLSKSGLFKHFDGKEAMQRAVIERAFDNLEAFVLTPLEDLPRGRRRLEAVFERWIEWGRTEWAAGGCPINAISMELDDRPGDLRDYLRQRQLAWRWRR